MACVLFQISFECGRLQMQRKTRRMAIVNKTCVSGKLLHRDLKVIESSTMYDFLLVRHCSYSSILYHLRVIWRWIYRDLENWLRGLSRSLKLMPFKSLVAVSYSPSIVTMAVSVAILEIFSVKEWRDLEIWVWGPSRSLKKARFDRPSMTFC